MWRIVMAVPRIPPLPKRHRSFQIHAQPRSTSVCIVGLPGSGVALSSAVPQAMRTSSPSSDNPSSIRNGADMYPPMADDGPKHRRLFGDDRTGPLRLLEVLRDRFGHRLAMLGVSASV